MKKLRHVTISVFILTTSLFAQWSSDTQVNTPICTANDAQSIPQIISDDSSGAIIVWNDGRYEQFGGDIYAQRIDSSGYAKWTADGVAICTAANTQSSPLIVSDGVGGAIVAWEDERNAYNIYAQRISSGGSIMWTTDGVPVSADSGEQILQGIISDGSDGAIIEWLDYRTGGINGGDIYAQRIDGSGSLLWTPGGVPVCTASDEQLNSQIIEDGAGGAINGMG